MIPTLGSISIRGQALWVAALLVLLTGGLPSKSCAASIAGAGAAFGYPLIAKWGRDYKKLTGTEINFQALGSGGGIKQIEAKSVDFSVGAALAEEEARNAGILQWPAFVSGVVPVVNIPGLPNGALRLNGNVLARIYLAKIKKWNDPAISKINPGIPLPDIDIYPVHWANGSAETLAFTTYLSESNAEWRFGRGAGSVVNWSSGLAVKGDRGVALKVIQVVGAIGYVDFGFAKANGLNIAVVANQDGRYVRPGSKAFSSCARRYGQDPPRELSLGRGDAWAICALGFIFINRIAESAEKSAATLRFFDWTMNHGAADAESLDYGTPPPETAIKIRELWKTHIRTNDGKSVYP